MGLSLLLLSLAIGWPLSSLASLRPLLSSSYSYIIFSFFIGSQLLGGTGLSVIFVLTKPHLSPLLARLFGKLCELNRGSLGNLGIQGDWVFRRFT